MCEIMHEQLPSEKSIFEAIFDESSRAERAAYLDRVCAGDAQLRREVEALLNAHDELRSIPKVAPARALGATSEFTRPGAAEGRERAVLRERPSTVIGPYKLLEQIGEGGMGLVFMAEQMQPVRRRVALKVLKPGLETRQVVARFEAERQALALMDHPHIAKVFDAGVTESGRPYFVMELVRGVHVTDYCDKRRLTTRQRLELFVTVCQAVQHAHHKGIIHRDLKPSNVLVTQHDAIAVPKIIDFGIAKATSQPLTERTLFTNFAQMIGTPLYMSPEQAEMNDLDVDTRSDVYALGVVLYELLTGTTPFASDTLKKVGLDEMRRMIREEEPPAPSRRLSTLSAQAFSTVSEQQGVDGRKLKQVVRGELDWIVMKALEKNRDRRYESANALAADVQRYLNDESVTACPPTASYRVRKYIRRNRRTLIPASIVALALVAATSVSTWQAARARDAQRTAEANAKAARRAVDKMYLQVAEKWLGRQPLMDQVQKDFVDEVLRYYQEFSLLGTQDRESRFEAALANQRVGAILNYAFAEKIQAREAALRALKVLKNLADEDPEEPEYLLELARTYGLLAHTRRHGIEGNEFEEENLRESVRLLEPLIARFPTESKYRAALSRSLINLCNPMLYGHRWPEVQETSRQALALLEPLIRETPNPDYFKTRAHAYHHLAEAQARGGAPLTEAIESQRNAVASFERLAKDDSEVPEYQHQLKPWDWHMLGRCYSYLAELLAQSKDFQSAENAAERSVRIYDRVAADFPNMPEFLEAQGGCHRKLGELYRRQGKRSEAEAEFRQAAKIAESLRGGLAKVP
jgi:serine/threonine protein kinase